ncbi:MAG: hypothetical protein M1825_004999, partial [Sarcosagium campestre]
MSSISSKSSSSRQPEQVHNDLEKPPTRQTLPMSRLSKVTTAQDWTGKDDPEDPKNWAFREKAFHTFIPAVLGFTVSFGSSVYTPGYPEVMKEFNVSSTVALLPLSLYVFGLGFGPILAAPLSESYGRAVVYKVAVPISAFFVLGAGFSQSIAALTICRFFAGVFGSPPLAIGGGTMADLWEPSHRAVASSLFALAPFFGPAIGPVIGGFAAENKGWRWTQWTILFFAAFAIAVALPARETYKKAILERRAKRLGLAPPPRGPTGLAAIKFLLTVTILRPVSMLFTEPIVGFFSLYVAFNFSVLFGFFEAFPLVFGGVYHFTTGQVGLTFLAIGIGCILAFFTIVTIDRLVYHPRFIASLNRGSGDSSGSDDAEGTAPGFVAPEHRLYAAMAGSTGLPVGLFWFAWTAREDVHWISPVLAAIPFAWGNLMVFMSSAMYLIDTYGSLNGASAMAANGLLRYSLGAVFPLFTIQSKNRLARAIKAYKTSHPDTTFTISWHAYYLNPDAPTPGVDKLEFYHAKFGPERTRA